MNLKDLKKNLDPKASYFWCKDEPNYWRLVNAFTLKSVWGCDDRFTAVCMTRKLRGLRYQVMSVGEED